MLVNWMSRLTKLTQLVVLLFCLTGLSAAAQEPHHSRISIVHPGFGQLKSDLKSVIDLTTPVEQEQWINIQDYLDMFQIGIDGSRPIRVDVLTGITPICYLVWVPLLDPEDAKMGLADEFRDSLDAFGYLTPRDNQDRNLYRIENSEGADDMGWLRVMPEIKYGVFVLTTDREDMQLLKQIVLRTADPRNEVAKLLENSPGIGAEGVNAAESADDQAKRREAFAELRKISMDTIQKRPAESKSEFEVRQALFRHQLDEGERLMVEASEIRATASFDPQSSNASLEFTATAIAETSLAESIALFGKQPDAFATAVKPPGSALSVRVNHPIDSMRQANYSETVELTERELDSRIETSADLSASEKEAARKLVTGIKEVIQDGLKTGYINGFVEAVPGDAGEFTMVGAVSAPQATRLNDILPLLASAGKGNKVEANVAQAGSVTIHKIQLAKGYVTIIDRVFGEEIEMYVGVAESYVWMASGPNALDSLSSSIKSLGEPQTSDSCIRIEANALPWVKRMDQIAKTATEGATPEEKEKQRSNARTRARAIAAMEAQDDRITLEAKVLDGVVSGNMTFDKGIMRFIGKVLSAFSRENFDG